MHYTRISTSESEAIYHSELITDRLILCVQSVRVYCGGEQEQIPDT